MLLECNHVGCPDSGPMRDEITNKVAGGVSDAAILDGFVERYGATVLSAPTFKGFDLVAWIMPFAVAAAALMGTIFLVRHWAKQQAAAPAPMNAAQALAAKELRERRETGTGEGV
jgi:cytochrome c-type biogenesis protein CcmH